MEGKNGFVVASSLPKVRQTYPEVKPFICWENTLMYWNQKLENTSVKIPETRIIKGSRKESGLPEFNESKIEKAVEEVGEKAFVRGGLGSASHLRNASVFDNKSNHSIEKTVMEMVFHTEVEQKLFLGEKPCVVIRELLDLDFEKDDDNIIPEESHPHIRFFIRNGEVKSYYNRIDTDNKKQMEQSQEHINNNIEKLTKWAEECAKEFQQPFSVDFVMDTNSNWYCIDMALDGIYWNTRDEQWSEISAHKKPLTETINQNLPNIEEINNNNFYMFP